MRKGLAMIFLSIDDLPLKTGTCYYTDAIGNITIYYLRCGSFCPPINGDEGFPLLPYHGLQSPSRRTLKLSGARGELPLDRLVGRHWVVDVNCFRM